MIDVGASIHTHLVANVALYALTGERIWGEVEAPDADYDAATDGQAIAFKTRGGEPDSSDALLQPSVQFQCYGSDEIEANECYRALYAALHHKQGATVRWASCETLGVTLREPDSERIYVLTYFRVWIANP
jgi:hypothetical protein